MIKTFEFEYEYAEAIFKVDTEKFTAEIAESILESYIWDLTLVYMTNVKYVA